MNNNTTTANNTIETSSIYAVRHHNACNSNAPIIAYVWEEDLSTFAGVYSRENYALYTLKDYNIQTRVKMMKNLFMSKKEYDALPFKPLHAFVYEPIAIWSPDDLAAQTEEFFKKIKNLL